MSVRTETLMAYVDGELTPEEARGVEAEIAAKPELKAFVEQQEALRRGLHDSFDAVFDLPLPEAMLAAAAQPPSLRWRLAQAFKALVSRRVLIWSGIPAAAALACGVAVGVLITSPGGANIVSMPGGLVARGALSATLSGTLSGRPVQTAEVQIGISFRDKTGRYCRTFQTGGASPLAGVACHQGGDWHIAALAVPAKEEGAGTAYHLAGSAMPDAVRSAVRGMISGSPLDATGEQNAMAHGWKIP